MLELLQAQQVRMKLEHDDIATYYGWMQKLKTNVVNDALNGKVKQIRGVEIDWT